MLRPHQLELDAAVCQSWASGARNVLATMATGGGKTVLFSHRAAEEDGATVCIAHRRELVGQMSMALARNGVQHRVVGPASVVRTIVGLHMAEFGRSYFSPNAWAAVAGVDTLLRQAPNLRRWLPSVKLWVMDEAHHVLAENKWGKGVDLFPNARGLGVTATPGRADGKGLGRHAHGVMDSLVEGADAARLLHEGWLCGYKVFGPPSNYRAPGREAIGSTGDIKLQANVTALRESSIMGDLVTHYERHARGKKAVAFLPDIATATEAACKFRAAGWRAEVVSGKTPEVQRDAILRQFRDGDYDVIVNVDLFGEGFDLPAIDCVIMARRTESLQWYLQAFGRGLRPIWADGTDMTTRGGRLWGIANGPKPRATIIDHVGNVPRHLLPDTPRIWTLDATAGGDGSGRARDVVPVRTCPGCEADYERFRLACPECGLVPEPASRAAPEFVDGDLTELDATVLESMRGAVADIDSPAIPRGLTGPAALGYKKRDAERRAAQHELRQAIAWWAGYQRSMARDDRESYRRFYHQFGVDVMTAQTLGRPDAEKLAQAVRAYLTLVDVQIA